MQGYFDEVALELADSGKGKLPVYINGYERKDENEQPLFIRFTIFRASDRRLYEENLQIAKQLAEANLRMEQENARKNFEEREEKLVNIIQTGSKRMYEMINDIMDLARGRLGRGFPVNPIESDIERLLTQVSDELKIAYPERTIELDFDISRSVSCDPGRFSQLVSNLLANAITHGSPTAPVFLTAKVEEYFWEVSVINQGKPIPKEALKSLFHPFRR